MRWVGVDENGLGPRLGPLVATACCIEGLEPSAGLPASLAQVGFGDSKATAGFGTMAHAEGLALALAENALGRAANTADDVLAAFSLDPLDVLRAPCPTSTVDQCFTSLAVPAFGGDPAPGHAMLARLAAEGGRVTRLRSALACVRRYNEMVAVEGSKLVVDLRLFERLLLDAATAGGPIHADCGRVGGIRRYLERFKLLPPLATILEETPTVSSYRIGGVGDVRFLVDADATSLPVAIASMVGKVLRELWMGRMHRFYSGLDAAITTFSGYHDPVTTRFVDASRILRATRGIDDGCFERRS